MLYLVALASVIVDLYTKALAVSKLKDASVPLINDVLHFTYVQNTGAAFGIFKNGNVFFIIASILILAAIAVFLIKCKPSQGMVKIAAGLIVGGALGNLFDRIFRGFVVDFIDFRLINYPVFNIADCCIVCGAILFAVWVIFFDKKDEQN